MTQQRETRALSAPVEVRATDSGRMVVGHAVNFNSETVIAGLFREKFAPGAFAKSIAEGDIRALFNHNTSLLLGRTKSGTLRVSEDDQGLHYEVDLPDTQAGRDLSVSMDRGDIDGSSFGFRSIKEEWDESGDLPLRTIIEAELFEVSPVTFPAYPDTSIALRSLTEARKDTGRRNSEAAQRRIAARRAETEMRLRGISPAE